MFDDEAKNLAETFKEDKQFDATGGTSGMDISNMMQNIEKEDKEFMNNQYDDEEEEEDDTKNEITGIHDNYDDDQDVSQDTKQIQEEYNKLEQEIRDMQKVINDQVKGDGSLDFSAEKDDEKYYDETPQKQEESLEKTEDISVATPNIDLVLQPEEIKQIKQLKEIQLPLIKPSKGKKLSPLLDKEEKQMAWNLG